LDVSKAEKEFGFKAKIGLEEGLRRTIDWYYEHKPALVSQFS
jgi:GDP-L-fucose synthase